MGKGGFGYFVDKAGSSVAEEDIEKYFVGKGQIGTVKEICYFVQKALVFQVEIVSVQKTEDI